SKGSHHVDLFLSKWLWHNFPDKNHPNIISLAQERYTKCGSVAANFLSLTIGIFCVLQHIDNVNNLTLQRCSASRAASIGKDLPVFEEILDALMHLGRMAEARAKTEMVPFALEQPCMVRVTKARRGLDQRVEHSLQVEV